MTQEYRMIDLETLVGVALVIGFGVYTARKRRVPNHGLPHLASVMNGDADEGQLRDLADALARSVIERAKSLKMQPLFVTASGDMYDDFFPAREVAANWTPEQSGNAVLADCVSRYRDARNNRNIDITDLGAYNLCAGAGLAVSAFRRLAVCSRDMRDLAEFLAPVPAPEDWEAYREYYRRAGELLGVPQARVEAGLAKRREHFRAGNFGVIQ